MNFKNKIAILIAAMILGGCMMAGCGDNNNTTSNLDNTSQQSNNESVGSQDNTASQGDSENTGDNNSSSDNTNSDNTNSDNTNSDNTNSDNTNSDNTNSDNTNSDNTNSDNTGNNSSREPSDGDYGYVNESSKADVSYFDNVVFVGDSVSYKLKLYNDKNNVMGNAKFLTSGSLGYGNALWDLDKPDAVFPTYQGDNVLIEDGVSAMGVEKVYIMLGMNDIGLYGIDGSIENMKKLTSRILDKSPDVQIYIQSVTPILQGMEGRTWNNKAINEFNDKLCQVCEENNFYFIDVASVMKDENGCLPAKYCSDPDTMGIHFTDEACVVWIDYLLTHTK